MKIQMEQSSLLGTISASNQTNTIKNNTFCSEQLLEIEKNTAKNNSCLDAKTIYEKETNTGGNPLLNHIVEATTNSFPYSHLAKDGENILVYKGAVFVGDGETNTLCLGDMSEKDNLLTIPLSDGGSLIVNRDNLDQLGKAIDMFSPKDINRIMKAISTDAKIKSKELEVENNKLNPFMDKKTDK